MPQPQHLLQLHLLASHRMLTAAHQPDMAVSDISAGPGDDARLQDKQSPSNALMATFAYTPTLGRRSLAQWHASAAAVPLLNGRAAVLVQAHFRPFDIISANRNYESVWRHAMM